MEYVVAGAKYLQQHRTIANVQSGMSGFTFLIKNYLFKIQRTNYNFLI